MAHSNLLHSPPSRSSTYPHFWTDYYYGLLYETMRNGCLTRNLQVSPPPPKLMTNFAWINWYMGGSVMNEGSNQCNKSESKRESRCYVSILRVSMGLGHEDDDDDDVRPLGLYCCWLGKHTEPAHIESYITQSHPASSSSRRRFWFHTRRNGNLWKFNVFIISLHQRTLFKSARGPI